MSWISTSVNNLLPIISFQHPFTLQPLYLPIVMPFVGIGVDVDVGICVFTPIEEEVQTEKHHT